MIHELLNASAASRTLYLGESGSSSAIFARMDTSARDMSLALLCAFRGFALLLGAFAFFAFALPFVVAFDFFAGFLRAMTFSDEDRDRGHHHVHRARRDRRDRGRRRLD